ncbi:unnamed protein product [Thelazia callipaeda]|uniref:Drf_GBD domain-containing protein n=1 Tax=Thelazia callipaeda TaxID=103827 RepID=A0A0N5CLL7_THECL|nr:unnamed protein product [Thelazia callipaeda]
MINALCCLPEIKSQRSSASGKNEIKIQTGYPQCPIFTLDPSKLEKNEVDTAFPRLLAELDLSPEKQRLLIDQPIEKKCLLLIEQTLIKAREVLEKFGIGDDRIAEKFLTLLKGPTLLDNDASLRVLEALYISLRTQSYSFVEKFLKLGGEEYLRSLLNDCRNTSNRENHANAILLCFRALLNSTVFFFSYNK